MVMGTMVQDIDGNVIAPVREQKENYDYGER